MNCEEFRGSLSKIEGDIPDNYFSHMGECPLCAKWIDSSISIAPEGFSSPQIEEPRFELSKKILPQSIPWVETFFKNLFAGLAVGAAAACLWFFAPNVENKMSFDFVQREDFSFLPEESKLADFQFVPEVPHLQNFHSREGFDEEPSEPLQLNFLGTSAKISEGDSFIQKQNWSFLEKESPINFLEDFEEGES